MKTNKLHLFRMTLLLLSMTLAITFLTATFAGGDGSEFDPYLIETAQQLNEVRNNLDSNFRQIADIDLSGYSSGNGWEPIGDSKKEFVGTYYGSGYTITNLTIIRNNEDDIALFGYIKEASVGGIRLVDVAINGKDNVGSLAGRSENSNIQLSFVSGTVQGGENAGGLVGYQLSGNIAECYSTADVSAEAMVGALIGKSDGSVVNCYATGYVQAVNEVGGLIGRVGTAGEVSSCYSTGAVDGNAKAGGLIGYNFGTVSYSYWDTDSSSIAVSDGGTGRTTTEMTYPYAVNTFVGWDFVFRWIEDGTGSNGGYPIIFRAPNDYELFPFAGGSGTENDPWQIATALHLHNITTRLGGTHADEHFLQTADISLDEMPWNDIGNGGWEPIATTQILSFFGVYDGNGYTIEGMFIDRAAGNQSLFGVTTDAVIKDLGVTGVDITGGNYSAALVGTNMRDTLISNCFSTGTISSPSPINGYGLGGLVGNSHGGSIIRDSYSECNVTGQAEYAFGGLVGKNGTLSVIETSYSIGDVSGHNEVGGLVGTNSGKIESSYSFSSVVGLGLVGGLVGRNGTTTPATVSYSYSAGLVAGSHTVGGLIGLNSGVVINCHWDTETSGQTAQGAGVGRTTAEMTYPYAPNTYINWKFNEIWLADVTPNLNNGYPYHHGKGFAGGSGTSNDPWLIETAEQMSSVRNYLGDEHEDKYFEQIADITLNALPWTYMKGWAPIGNDLSAFMGTYDGQGHTIDGLYINRNYYTDEYVGLFGKTDKATIKDIVMADVSIAGYDIVGGLIAEASDSHIEHVSVSGAIEGSISNVGGLVGRLHGVLASVDFCYTSGVVSGTSSVGGLVGSADSSYVSNSYSTASVDGYSNVGGLVGKSDQACLTACYSTGMVAGTDSQSTGGLVGIDYNNSVFLNCYWDTDSSGQTVSAGGTGLTTYDMLWEDSYVNWSFNENPWAMKNPSSHVREVYPHLQARPGEHNYAEAMIKLYNQHINWYWESFPRLEIQNNDDYTTEVILGQVEGIVDTVRTSNYDQENHEMVWDGYDWAGHEIAFFSEYGYQLRFNDRLFSYQLYVRGEKITDDTEIPMLVDEENYIGYFVRETQHFSDAFGDQLDNIDYVLAQNWSANKVGDTWFMPSNSYLEYGKMYIVKTDSLWTGNFQWQLPEGPEIQYQYMAAEEFEFNDLDRYESIFIESMDDDEDILEVGVYAGDECVGGNVFEQSYPFEILAYTDQSHANETLSFVIHRGQRSEPERLEIADKLDFATGEYRTSLLRAGEQRMSVIRLGSDEGEIEPIVKPLITLAQNYPNPFVLSSDSRSNMTEIPFYLSEQREVTLSIFNIKGQKVSSVYSGLVNAGKHSISWNGHNDSSQKVGSGIYFYRLETGDEAVTRKMLIVR